MWNGIRLLKVAFKGSKQSSGHHKGPGWEKPQKTLHLSVKPKEAPPLYPVPLFTIFTVFLLGVGLSRTEILTTTPYPLFMNGAEWFIVPRQHHVIRCKKLSK